MSKLVRKIGPAPKPSDRLYENYCGIRKKPEKETEAEGDEEHKIPTIDITSDEEEERGEGEGEGEPFTSPFTRQPVVTVNVNCGRCFEFWAFKQAWEWVLQQTPKCAKSLEFSIKVNRQAMTEAPGDYMTLNLLIESWCEKGQYTIHKCFRPDGVRYFIQDNSWMFYDEQ